MATLGPTGTTTDVTTFTNFASWAGAGAFGINTALTNFGWTRTADLANMVQWAGTGATFTLTSVATSVGATAVYTGTITGANGATGAGNAYAGISFIVTGFTTGANNGTFACTASSATTLTLSNSAATAETHAATAQVTGAAAPFSGAPATTYPLTNQPANSYFINAVGNWFSPLVLTSVATSSGGTAVYTGTITGGGSNAFAGQTFFISGFTTAANNGVFSCTASSTTTLTLTNASASAETHAALASTIYSVGTVAFDSTTNTSYYLFPQQFPITSVTTSSGGTAVYTGTITGGGANAYAGLTFQITGNMGANTNGTFLCTASTTTTLTLTNGGASANSGTSTAFMLSWDGTTVPSSDASHWLVYDYELWQTNDSATFAQTAQSVSYVSSTQTLTLATNTTPNRLKAGFNVTISGASNFPQINGTWCVASATTTQLTFTIPNTLTGFTGNFSGTDSFSVVYNFQKIYMKLEYWGNTSSFTTSPWIRVSFGTGTDGLGNLTGNVVGSTNIGDARANVVNNGYIYLDLVPNLAAPSPSQASSIWRCIASGSNGRFGTALWYNRNDTNAANTNSLFWIVERAKDDSGNDLDDYFTYLAGVNAGGINVPFNNTNRFCQQRSILKWNPIVNISTVTIDSTNDLIFWYTSNTGYQFIIGATVFVGGLDSATFLNDQFFTIPQISLTLTSVANASGGSTVYTGTITGGTTQAYVNQKVTISGFTNSANNGTFLCTASTATTITLSNASGVAETHAATVSGNFFIVPFTHAAYATTSDTGTIQQSVSATTFTPIAGTGLPCEMDSNICTIDRTLASLAVNGLTPMLPVFPCPGFLGNPMTMAQAYSQGDAPVHDTTTTITLYGATRTYYFTHGTPAGSNTSNAGAPYTTFGDQGQTSVNAFTLRWD